MCRPRDCLIYIADTALTEFYTLSLHDALPISVRLLIGPTAGVQGLQVLPGPSLLPGVLCGSLSLTLGPLSGLGLPALADRSEEHTSELQSRENLVCRLLLEKKQQSHITIYIYT